MPYVRALMEQQTRAPNQPAAQVCVCDPGRRLIKLNPCLAGDCPAFPSRRGEGQKDTGDGNGKILHTLRAQSKVCAVYITSFQGLIIFRPWCFVT